MFIVYQLRLEDNRHYFGTTPAWRKETRMDEHRRGVGAQWTKLFPPVADPVVNTWEFKTRKQAYAYENDKCEEFLNLYGIDSTRGGKQNFREPGHYRYWVRKHLWHLVPENYTY